jgi:hypothetical protein
MPDFHTYDAIPEDCPPLYHYGAVSGFLGIVNSASLWFTHTDYMNDSREYIHAVDLIDNMLLNSRNYMPGYVRSLQALDKEDNYTFSLSEKPDLLSQWRAYCSTGGYCFSFKKDSLSALIRSNKISIGKCIYDENVQRQFIIDNIIPRNTSNEQSRGYRGSQRTDFEKELARRITLHKRSLLLFKHPSFFEEQEWRIIFNCKPDPLTDLVEKYYVSILGFRERNNHLIPFLSVPFHGSFPYIREVQPYPPLPVIESAALHNNVNISPYQLQDRILNKGVIEHLILSPANSTNAERLALEKLKLKYSYDFIIQDTKTSYR